MSCDAVAFSAVLWFASMGQGPAAPNTMPIILASTAAAPASVAGEPLFADIVTRARSLHEQVESYRLAGGAGPASSLPNYAQFRQRITELAALDMQGHTLLAQRGTDGDLKCILRGISQDLAEKLNALETASTAQARSDALRDMSALLRDNVEVITSPPQPQA